MVGGQRIFLKRTDNQQRHTSRRLHQPTHSGCHSQFNVHPHLVFSLWMLACSNVERNADLQISLKNLRNQYETSSILNLQTRGGQSCKRAAGENWFWQDNQWSWVSETNIREVLTCALFQKAQTFGDRHWKLLSYVAPKFFSQLLGGSFSRPTPKGGSGNLTIRVILIQKSLKF